MSKRVIVLDETLEAENRWPGFGLLARFGGGQYKLCCLGCLGITYGLDVEEMRGITMLSQFKDTPLDEYWHVVKTTVPLEVLERVSEITSYIRHHRGFEMLASALNDDLDSRIYRGESSREDVDNTVAALRILFAWMGNQLGEEWVINHIKDDRIFDHED